MNATLLANFRRSKIISIALLGVVVLGVLAWVYFDNREHLTREALIAYGKSIPAAWFIVCFLILPIIGCPFSICLLLVGIRFGIPLGIAITAVGMFFHSYIAYLITHSFLRKWIVNFVARFGRSIPAIKPNHQLRFTALFAAIHGPPYCVKLFILALANISFPIYFWVGTSIHFVFALLPICLGGAATSSNLISVLYWLPLLFILPIIGYWLRMRFAKRSKIE